MASTFPSKAELRCAGCSLIISQILLTAAGVLHGIDIDAYDVKNEEDVILLHDTITSIQHKAEVESGVALLWLSFPFLLIGLYGLKESAKVWYEQNSFMKLCVYLFEKSYILWLAVIMIIIPALSLVSVSYDWSFNQTITSQSVAPVGYYIQAYVILFQLELIDCASVADAIFILSIYIYFAIFVLSSGAQTGNKTWKQYLSIISGIDSNIIHTVGLIMNFCCILVMFIIFLIILFEFAESGFFSPTGHAKILFVLVFLSKMYFGILLILQTRQNVYNKLKVLAQNHREHGFTDTKEDNYQMEKIDAKANI